jgi:hypothetical protein
MAVHTFAVLDREVRGQEAHGRPATLVLRALADIVTTTTKAAGLDFSMIGRRTCRRGCASAWGGSWGGAHYAHPGLFREGGPSAISA